jgi:hypothetical protein
LLCTLTACGDSGKATPAAAPVEPARAESKLAVQVNQVALELHGPKVAVVEYFGSESQGRFDILRADTVVQSGPLVAQPAFSEWGAGKHYFQADFSTLASPGNYRVRVTFGGLSASSAPFDVVEHALFDITADKLISYFRENRWLAEGDKHIRIFDTQRYANVWGGWKDAGGDTGKYLSHLSFANFFSPQQAAMATWSLAKSYQLAPAQFAKQRLDARITEEAFWGADYLHRILDPSGYFYQTVFDRWGEPGAERVVTGYSGLEGTYNTNYPAAFREGGGVAIAALARASMLARQTGRHGEFSAAQYLADAEKAFAHLQVTNPKYCDDGVENIIDDYTALLAATELYHATKKGTYLQAARVRAANLNGRMTSDGWFVSDAKDRPYYHGAEAGFPILSLVYYLDVETDAARIDATKVTLRKALAWQLALDRAVANPYNYARQTFRIFKDGKLAAERKEGFFMPHANETKYWWQGESARLASLATAAILAGRIVSPDPKGAFGVTTDLATFAQNQIDWTLGRNPYGLCLLYGFGVKNPPHADSAGDMVAGGISNGITGAVDSDEGRGIVFAAGPDENNWRWIEQWIPHTTWFLLAATTMSQ